MAEIARLPANPGWWSSMLEWCGRPQKSILFPMPTLPIAAKTPTENKHQPTRPKRFELWKRFANG
ncbi:MAG: hypothetical protein Q9228_004156 [Teloschistes exilis]